MTFKTFLCEMAGTYTDVETGIGSGIYIKMEKVGGQHGPRVKVSNIPGKFARDDYFVVSIDSIPEVKTPTVKINKTNLARVKFWIHQNFSILLKMHYYLETGNPQSVQHNSQTIMLDYSGLEKLLTPIN